MRILLINQFFWPDSAATSQFLTDVARGLEELGHEVFVIASQSGYAPEDDDDPPRALIHRVKAIRFVWGPLGRLLSYTSFFIACAIRGLRLPRPDVVLTLTTPPLISLVGTLIKALRCSQHFVWEMDVYPEVATDVGFFKRGGLLDMFTGRLADFSHRRSDGIIALGECMRRRLMDRGLPAEKIHVAENWADDNLVRPLPHQSRADNLVVLYSGNLGLAHDIETVSEAIRCLKDDSRFHFVFAGNGPKRRMFEAWCQAQDIGCVEFRGYSERANLGESLATGDIGLVTQREACLGSVVPSKIYSLLAAGRPILFVGPKGATAADIIRRFGCGWHIQNGDTAGLVCLLRQLSADKTLLYDAGQRARQAFMHNYDRMSGVSRICMLIGAASKHMMAGAA
jgi:colanic acid biosynthesis glycosyl transferase WcaI